DRGGGAVMVTLLWWGISATAKTPEQVVDGRPEPWLIKKLAHDEPDALRAAIVSELGALKAPHALPQPLRSATATAAEVRTAAMAALSAYGGDLADPGRDQALLAGLRDASPACVSAAEAGLADRLQAHVESGLDAVVGQIEDLTRSGTSWQTRK